MLDSPSFASERITQAGNVNYGDDSGLLVEFYLHAVRQGFASEQAGRDIYKDEPYVWIRFAGDRTREVRRPVDKVGKGNYPPDHVRWPRQWAAFENQQAQPMEGTPLEHWPAVGKSTVMNFKAANVHTVEHLAAVTDAALHNLGTGAMELREKARVWLAAAKDSAKVTQLQDELAKRDADIKALREQLAEVARKVK